jgi:hypothetical protein
MEKPKLNREWHIANKMPKNATKDQRLRWHAEHAEHCACRPAPENLAAEISAWKKGGGEERGRGK